MPAEAKREAAPSPAAGSQAVVRLLPLAQAELHGSEPSLLQTTFTGELPVSETPVVGDDLVEIVLADGYTKVLTRLNWRWRQGWNRDYIDEIVQREVRDIARIEQLANPNMVSSWP